MNSKNAMLHRLLKLLPVARVREAYNSKNTKQDALIQEIIGKFTDKDIFKFVFDNLQYTK